MTVKVGILGASGYTGGELVRILSRHEGVEITHITSQRFAGQTMGAIFPHLQGVLDLTCQPMDVDRAAEVCELVFCALPHVTSMEVVPALLEKGLKVVDLSADFRLRDADIYAEWYGKAHLAPGLLSKAAYGLPELNRASIKVARLVANPGCYPTSVQLALAPLLAAGLIETDGMVVDSKSGASGAGRAPAQGTLYTEVSDGFKSYKMTGHRHTPEIEQELARIAGEDLTIRFTPHLLPQIRGIFSTCYVRPKEMLSLDEWRKVYDDFYASEPFVQLALEGASPATGNVRGSNRCDLGVFPDPRSGWLTVLSVIDNLVKGASGQAVQNMNLMCGFEETLGLSQAPLFP
ncbi:MAG: N-acetyl-gamma-glutamyl-phosphate reductase [Magnetococcales bacterium]|nr:N-acetyl-gamma-glutamyl-phosphate reductase [Magnetococcales bacterium]